MISTYYYHPDHLGSTQLVTNSTGGVVENTSYEPYGNTIEGSDSRYSYNSKERDIGTDLLYYGARYYYSNGPFFIMPDPFIQDYYNPQGLNRYSYVLNNPYRYIDPSGNFVWDVVDVSFFVWDIKTAIENPSLENIGWATLSGASLLPLLPNIAGYARYSEKALELTNDLNKIGKVENVAQGLKSYTQRNFRENLGRLTGISLSKTEEAHHVLPVKFEKDFNRARININRPEYGAIVGKTSHRSFSYQYNKDWETFFNINKNPNKELIESYGKHLSEQYKFKINYGVTNK